jgi:hypothetical protein
MLVTEPRDEVDNWLGQEVEPLAPPPGSFDRIHGRARRRKLNQALLGAAGAIVVIAGAALIPTVASRLLPGGTTAESQRSVSASSSLPSSLSPKPTRSTPATATHSVTPVPDGTALSRTTSGASPPPNFQPTSITMIGYGIGAVIGQAGTPGHCATQYCTSLAGTSTYGTSWYGVSAPPAGAADGGTGVSQLRFLNLLDGWAFGPQLYETSDGGRTWTAEQTSGLRVTDLEAAGTRAFAVLASCQGNAASFAADCTTFGLYTSAAGSTTWQRVGLTIPASLRAAAMGTAGHASAASLAIAGDAANVADGVGYLLSPSGDLLSGSVGGGNWTYVARAPCMPGAASAGGMPLGAQLAVGDGKLLISCAASGTGSSQQPRELWESSDGTSWSKVSQPPPAGTATSLASASGGQVILATTAGIDYSSDGQTWQSATITGGSPQGGFSYVGMTTATQGVALPADASLGEVFITSDGGQTWAPSAVSG